MYIKRCLLTLVGLAVFLVGCDGTDKAPSPSSKSSTQATASPLSCRGTSCNGHDPKDYGCDGDAETIGMEGTGVLQLELRYSRICRAVWAKLTEGEVGYKVYITPLVHGKSTESGEVSLLKGHTRWVRTGHTKYTFMLPAEGEVKVCGWSVPSAPPAACVTKKLTKAV